MQKYCKQIADNENFQGFILGLIALNAIVMGLETNQALNAYYDSWFLLIFWVSQLIFGLEMLIRLWAYAPKCSAFFKDFWNTFDFIVVAASFTPMVGPFAVIARLARILRIARAASVSDELRIFLHQMRISLRVFCRAALVAAIFGYIFAISGFYLFADVAPQQWGSLSSALRSLFYLSLLQDLPAQLAQVAGSFSAWWLFFVIFYGLWAIFIVNVFAAVLAQYLGVYKASSPGEQP
jgi:voltage-gated sodium channel